MRLIEIIAILLLFIPSYYIVDLIEKKLINKLPKTNAVSKHWTKIWFPIILLVVYLLAPISNNIIREPWIKTPPLSSILNDNSHTLKRLNITEIEINTRSYSLEYQAGKLISHKGTTGNVVTGYELETNIEDFYVTEIYLLKGFKASIKDGLWISEVPTSVTTRNVNTAKKQIEHLINSINKHFKNRIERKRSWN